MTVNYDKIYFCVYIAHISQAVLPGCVHLCFFLHSELINLDVSSMLSWISELSNGGEHKIYEV